MLPQLDHGNKSELSVRDVPYAHKGLLMYDTDGQPDKCEEFAQQQQHEPLVCVCVRVLH